MVKGGKKIIRRALLGKVPGQVAPKDKSLPADLIAFMALIATSLRLGNMQKLVSGL